MTEQTKLRQANAMLGLLAETSIHAGAGQSAGVIDLPIQREAHTDWPCVFASAVKGALRTMAEDALRTIPTDTRDETKTIGADELYAVFGPDPNNANDHAGALMVGDARLVLLPARSLTTHFKWVTCPALLDRLRRDADRIDLDGFSTLKLDQPSGAPHGLSPAWSACDETDIYLEDYRFKANDPLPHMDEIIKALATLSDRDGFEDALKRQLVIVDDDVFRDLCRQATPVNAHVRLESKTKTVKRGALWYEETLPPDTLLCVTLNAGPARRRLKDSEGNDLGPMNMDARAVLRAATRLLRSRPYVQIGGNETVGMGWCHLKSIHATKSQGN